MLSEYKLANQGQELAFVATGLPFLSLTSTAITLLS